MRSLIFQPAGIKLKMTDRAPSLPWTISDMIEVGHVELGNIVDNLVERFVEIRLIALPPPQGTLNSTGINLR